MRYCDRDADTQSDSISQRSSNKSPEEEDTNNENEHEVSSTLSQEISPDSSSESTASKSTIEDKTVKCNQERKVNENLVWIRLYETCRDKLGLKLIEGNKSNSFGKEVGLFLRQGDLID